MASLPQLIGPTEKALTRVLLERGLDGLRIRSNAEWVALNRRDGMRPSDGYVAELAAVLSIDPDAARTVLTELIARGLVERRGDRVTTSETGRSELHAARQRVSLITAELERDVTSEDRLVTERVLGQIRNRATDLLTATRYSR